MDRQSNTLEKTKKFWISITGYRTLLILKSLMVRSYTIDELVEILKNDSITNKAVSKDTVRIAINTLKSVGCEILRPNKANNYKYQLIKHPFSLKISDKELKTFTMLRDKIAEEIKYDDVFTLNDLYEKLISLTLNEEQIDYVNNTQPLKKINKKILKDITNQQIIGKKVQIKYLSPNFGEEDIEVIPQKITYESGKIYLRCYIFKYETNSLLNVERILKINSIDMFNIYNKNSSYKVVYELCGNSKNIFKVQKNEKIISGNTNSIKVEALVDNEFLFIQRLLLFGTDFKIISPDFFREKLIDKIKLIQKGYKE
ncbi:TPA: WYL domain-containing protein [Candidatus Avigastranaerophilus faecigallinarum]|nr:WYL domain-containing protein [Candidatus Avigastranaerophilus faecigallinarum]